MSLSILDYGARMESGNSPSLLKKINWSEMTVSASEYLLILLPRELSER